jgi:uncharacterized membrane protein YedE/YeeE
MNTNGIPMALAGGGLIGLAAGIFLLLQGRIAGISGIYAGLLHGDGGERAWRSCFIAGLLAGGLVLRLLLPGAIPTTLDTAWPIMAAAGMLVGFGTQLGSGCTSGHGVCGIGRLSLRSMVATVVFLTTGMITVLVAGGLG